MSNLFLPHPLFEARVDTIGQDKAPILIIDHFCSEPDHLVSAAESAFGRGSRRREGFPGIVTPADEAFARSAVTHLMPAIRKTFGVSGRIESGGFDFQLMTSPPTALSPRQMRPHYDVADTNVVASVLFLCHPPFLGTGFYRHNATGFEVITPDRVTAYDRAQSELDSGTPSGGYINGDTLEFTQIAYYTATFNRLILFSAASLHSGSALPEHGFSSEPRRGRLTANLFLKFAR